MTARMCDGHPSAECRSGCAIDCAFNTSDLAYTKAAEKHFASDYPQRYEVNLNDAHMPPAETPLHIRCLDWLGNTFDAAKQGFFGAFRDAWAIVSHPWAQFSYGAVGAVFTCWLAVEMFIAMWRSS